MSSDNFSFFAEHSALFLELATAAEKAFTGDPNTTLVKLRQLGEAMAQELASRVGIAVADHTKQNDLLNQLKRELSLDPQILSLFHTLRIEGNKATHQFRTRHKDALDGLRVARTIAVWYHQSFGEQGASFKPGPFIAPTDPSQELTELQQRIAQLQAELGETKQALNHNVQLSNLLSEEKEQYAVLAQQMSADAQVYEELALEHEQALAEAKANFDRQLAIYQTQQDKTATQAARVQTDAASKQLVLSEELTRIIIDQQLEAAGWEADSELLTYAAGARPEHGKNKAISEWPCANKQRADYVLFFGLIPIAVVEAKKQNTSVADKIPQAERYSRAIQFTSDAVSAWQQEGRNGPWPDGQQGSFHVPFVYSCNGRPYFKQLAEQSGTWFRDVRHTANLSRALVDFHRPDELSDLLTRSREAAEAVLSMEGFAYLRLRDYQQTAIHAVEQALAHNQRNVLLAMATGTGKTRTIIGLIYRFLKAERFRRILFLVDRTALGEQAIGAFNDAVLEQNLPLSKHYNIAELGDMAAEAETRVHVATVQAMVSRVLANDSPPGVGEYDCIIVDEAHRGYTLDQEMTEGEQALRDQKQYLSRYRQVLDYFDAVRIGLTATPAKHTAEIFGKPVYTYSYREAVADDWLIDHEPPIRYTTLLAQNGISFDKGSEVEVINIDTGEIENEVLADDISFDIEGFNRRVINEDFNKVICEQLAKEIDPLGEEKTLIFCATDKHADMVKRLLEDQFKALYGDDYNAAAVQKITGQSDRPSQLIRNFKNERFPSVAITVDLLTTGIDVPRICHLVFMRRVRSRILYEQMIGRATRRCDDIGKTIFYIYDPVDLYATLQDVNTMQPLVKDPNVTLDQLIGELHHPLSQQLPGGRDGSVHADDLLAQICQKVMRVLRKADNKAQHDPQLRQQLDELQQQWGVAPAVLHQYLHQLGPQGAIAFLRQHSQLLPQLDQIRQRAGTDYRPLISHHHDELLVREQSYGDYHKPADYLDSFRLFIRTQLNQNAALAVVINRPRDLTRVQLKEVRQLLDNNKFSESTLKTAWRNSTNQDIAASIIGYIRQAALGEALIPFGQRVDNAMQNIYTMQNWTSVQRRWLERLAKILKDKVVLEQDDLNEAFRESGGARALDKLLDQQLQPVLDKLVDGLWPVAA